MSLFAKKRRSNNNISVCVCLLLWLFFFFFLFFGLVQLSVVHSMLPSCTLPFTTGTALTNNRRTEGKKLLRYFRANNSLSSRFGFSWRSGQQAVLGLLHRSSSWNCYCFFCCCRSTEFFCVLDLVAFHSIRINWLFICDVVVVVVCCWHFFFPSIGL